MYETHFTGAKIVFGQGREQTDHRPRQHFREMPRRVGLHAQRQHGHIAVHIQTRAEGVREQAHVAQRMAQANAKGFAGEKQILQKQAMESGQVLGQAIKVFVVSSRPELSEADVLRHCRAHLEDYMLPKYVEFCAELPKTTSGKIKKTELA